jgi:Flp pilus assembly protein TadD
MGPRLPRIPAARLIGHVAALSLLAGALTGCVTGADTTASLASRAPRSEADWRRSVDDLAARYRANPTDVEIALRYAQSLRATGQRTQAVAVLEQASLTNPNNMVLLGAYGRALADVGHYKQALEVLERSHTPDQPDWRILSAQGAVLDQLGRHQDAQRYYSSALKIVPEEPSVLSNLGLSYALAKNLPQAEATLRRASANGSADPRVRQNLALVVGLQGRFAEAETIARADLPPEEAAANVAYLKQMLSEQKPATAQRKPSRRREAKPTTTTTSFAEID